MAFKYEYYPEIYDTEAEAQAAVVSMKSRLDNNPTDWCQVKEITGSNEDGWTVSPTLLTDAQINNLDATKTYLVYAIYDGDNYMPLTKDEAVTKINAIRSSYVRLQRLHEILKLDDSATIDNNGNVVGLNVEVITPNEDMSGYL